MNLSFYSPKNPLLSRFIEGYYFICEDQKGSAEKYWTFPNNYCILTINLNSNLTFFLNKIQISPSSSKCLTVSCVHRYTSPIEVTYEKPVQEITIYFKPIGINCFTKKIEGIFSRDIIIDIDYFFPNLTQEIKRIFLEQNRTTQIEELESYLLSIYENRDLKLIQNILTDIESNFKIEEVARRNNMSRKHLNTIVMKYLGKTAVEYRKIHRFRSSLKKYKELKNLTELSYENLFYDQSHFIKNFKSLTGINPRSFFKNVQIENENIWFFI